MSSKNEDKIDNDDLTTCSTGIDNIKFSFHQDFLRVSSFCSGKDYLTNKNLKHNFFTGKDKEETKQNEALISHRDQNHCRSIQVSISVLQNLPIRSTRSELKKNHSVSKKGVETADSANHLQKNRKYQKRKVDRIDVYATVYCESPDLLILLQIFEGNLCKLLLKGSDGESYRWSPVILKVLPKLYPKVPTSCIEKKPSKQAIYVPPCVAATLGLCPRTLINASIDQPVYVEKMEITSIDEVPIARKALIREIGIPPTDFLPSFGMKSSYPSKWKSDSLSAILQSERLKRDELKNKKQLKMLQRLFFDRSGKVRKRLMGIGTIFEVVDEDESTNNSFIRFYELVHFDEGKPGDNSFKFSFLSPDTKLILSSRNQAKQYPLLALPQVSLVYQFYSSIHKQSIWSENKEGSQIFCPKPVIPYSHHCRDTFVDAILLRGRKKNLDSPSHILSDYTLHVIGEEENHVRECLDSAADIVGMRSFHIDGLAAFSYKNALSTKEPPQVSGLIQDKIQGLISAFKIAAASFPVIIHICKFDEELSDIDDTESKHDEEQRFLQCFKNELKFFFHSYLSEGFCAPQLKVSSGEYGIPPILLVLSSQKPFSSGPISSLLSSHQAIIISKPNGTYARALWGDDSTFEIISSHLVGLTAKEILLVRHEFNIRTSLKGDVKDNVPLKYPQIINLIKKDMESGTLQHLRKKSSMLSSSLIPNIHWDDVGGLAHVRNEIIDAIELPLRHPELFTVNKRSGILLFGPPGSGKTLVAKAIATECGLPFLSVKGPELLGSYVGESEANIRATFLAAREAAAVSSSKNQRGSAILFFDELDSLAPRRGGTGDGGGVMERVVASLLGELDKCTIGEEEEENMTSLNSKSSSLAANIFIIGATNRPDLLDPSLLRPGRFDRLVYLGLAKGKSDRASILAALTRKFSFENDLDSLTVATKVIDHIPESLSGADFSAIASGAMMRALTRLCDEADKELLESTQKGNIGVEDVICSWDKNRQTPKVTLEDLICAAKDIQPSVTESDLKHYDQLKDQFSNSV